MAQRKLDKDIAVNVLATDPYGKLMPFHTRVPSSYGRNGSEVKLMGVGPPLLHKKG